MMQNTRNANVIHHVRTVCLNTLRHDIVDATFVGRNTSIRLACSPTDACHAAVRTWSSTQLRHTAAVRRRCIGLATSTCGVVAWTETHVTTTETQALVVPSLTPAHTHTHTSHGNWNYRSHRSHVKYSAYCIPVR